MGSCSNGRRKGKGKVKGLDVAVGELVWVRRGNGSWWPGQIMDVDEAYDSCVDVDKAREVPIKLLGRDELTVEWYDLGETKRVKAFRCGDHDSCIEKARAAKANPIKKSLRHARREYAIIDALDLETALRSKVNDNCSGADNVDDERSKDSQGKSVVIGLNAYSNNRSFKKNIDSAPQLSHSGVSFEEANAASALHDGHLDKVKRQRTPNDSEDDGNEGMKKRMRGLDDLGVGFNMKELTGLVTESAPEGLASVSYLSASSCLPIGHLENGSNGGITTFVKKKRSKVVFQDILKRKNRRRMLTKVLQNDTTKVLQNDTWVSVPIIFDDSTSPCKPSNYDGSSSPAIYDNSNSDSTDVSCQIVPLKNYSEHCEDAAITNRKDHDMSSIPELLGYDSLDNLFDVPLIYEAEISDVVVPIISPIHITSPVKPQNGSSVENLCQNNLVEVGPLSNETQQVSETQQESGTASSAAANVCLLITQKTEKGPSEWQLKGRRNSRHQNRNPEQDSKRPTDPKDESKTPDPDTHLDRFSPPPQHKQFQYRQSRFSVLPSYEIPDPSIRSLYPDSVLFDVCIEVKASYRPQHVPYISLMSRLNGKPITGHPIAVEVLQDGECDILVDVPGPYPTNGAYELGDDDNDDELMEPINRSSKKQLVLQPHFPPRKSSKTKKQGSSKKTRRLSSLTGARGKLLKERKLVVRSVKAPAVACVPLKVVFSRINEALNGSTRTNRVS